MSNPALITPSTKSVDSADYFNDFGKGNSPLSSKYTTLGLEVGAKGNRSPKDVSSAKVMSHSSQSPFNSERSIREDLHSTPHSHSRNRESNKGSGGTDGGSSASSLRSDRDRSRKHRPSSQKTMLSKALQKANTAVLLDNAQNFEGAMEAYEDACMLLQRVMYKSTGDEDKKKLQSIVSPR